jgi:hypothetical protein
MWAQAPLALRKSKQAAGDESRGLDFRLKYCISIGLDDGGQHLISASLD